LENFTAMVSLGGYHSLDFDAVNVEKT